MVWKQVSIAALLLQAVCCTPEPGASPDDGGSAVLTALGRDIDQYVSSAASRGFSGAVLVVLEGKVVLRKGYGWTDSSRSFPITPQTRFFIASVTKGLTAAAILKLEEAGQLSLDQTLAEFFDGVPSQLQAATLQQVLVHRSGLGNNYGGSGTNDRDAAVADIFSFPVAYPPGTDFTYSNDGYSLLAAVIEVTARMPFEDYVRKNLLEPAQMRSAGFWGQLDDLDPSRFAQKKTRLSDSTRAPNWGYRGSGGVAASLEDLHRWFLALRDGKVLSSEGRKRLLGPHHTLGSGTGVGYGWFVSPTPAGTVENWSRGGEDFGHNAVIR